MYSIAHGTVLYCMHRPLSPLLCLAPLSVSVTADPMRLVGRSVSQSAIRLPRSLTLIFGRQRSRSFSPPKVITLIRSPQSSLPSQAPT
ncbi:hypothetical protein BCV70DRAFT_6775 [Testicularia cyperi]|uniref:Uncharacterized protein n=1 Tax=Testicularia cyperi TaxID=1882483 RepID=A0A317XZM8_9BASI|nr:hypothetical protein BCV70DRAFT_6775 [Testicularia cyperi]